MFVVKLGKLCATLSAVTGQSLFVVVLVRGGACGG